ncbi:MAG: hypothetical protein IAE92_00520 [Burkholderiaceae bacterium]|nr:hypothetical protein [Burkholderiaceae bacterium]
MKTDTTLSRARRLAGAALLLPLLAQAHEGHGLTGASHWHATDVWGILGMATAIALVVWFTRGGK